MNFSRLSRPLIVLLIALALFAVERFQNEPTGPAPQIRSERIQPAPQLSSTPLSISNAIRNRADHVQVTGEGRVVKILRDDTHPPRHQQFLITVNGAAKTVKIAHNIDLAPKIKGLKKGDPISFSGEYIWNDKGGVLHWTHASDTPSHPGGWLEVSGRRYQ